MRGLSSALSSFCLLSLSDLCFFALYSVSVECSLPGEAHYQGVRILMRQDIMETDK